MPTKLDALLARAERRFGDGFVLWSVGDLVNRGPDSRRVLERVRELEVRGRARMVLGNHELSLIACHYELRRPHKRDTIDALLGAPDAADWIDWLRAQPLVIRDRENGVEFAMVHAAPHTEWSLDALCERVAGVEAKLAAADEAELLGLLRASRLGDGSGGPDSDADLLDRVTCCRSVDDAGRWSSALPGEKGRIAWHARWAAQSHRCAIVYGHWALQGLHVADGLRGLDTGCVHHTEDAPTALTAWLPSAIARADGVERDDPFAAPDERFWREPAHAVHFQRQ